MLHLIDIHKTYAKREIIRIPSIYFYKGIYLIKGGNGTGKTTLLKIIAGLIPFDGDIIYDEISIRKQPAAYRNLVSWAMAAPLFPEFVRGQDLINLYSSIRKVNKSEADELITLFNMQAYVHLATGAYSSGMMKKLAIVLALIGKMPLIILDEPFITLDKETIPILCSLISDWHLQYEISFIVSSHLEQENLFQMPYRQLAVSDQTLHFLP